MTDDEAEAEVSPSPLSSLRTQSTSHPCRPCCHDDNASVSSQNPTELRGAIMQRHEGWSERLLRQGGGGATSEFWRKEFAGLIGAVRVTATSRGTSTIGTGYRGGEMLGHNHREERHCGRGGRKRRRTGSGASKLLLGRTVNDSRSDPCIAEPSWGGGVSACDTGVGNLPGCSRDGSCSKFQKCDYCCCVPKQPVFRRSGCRGHHSGTGRSITCLAGTSTVREQRGRKLFRATPPPLTIRMLAVFAVSLLLSNTEGDEPFTVVTPSGKRPRHHDPDESLSTWVLPDDEKHIGDGIRSTSSTSRFFQSVDHDGDGLVSKNELASFVRDKIGGKDFDTSLEINSEVNTVLESLDQNRDDGLDRGDVLAYWMTLESLLTADEVAEWVVHAVQLPESVGTLFRQHCVTGYDFPELVENDGEALLTEMGIDKVSFRRKLVRAINARMLRVGDVPDAPSGLDHTVESCSTVTLAWKKAYARGFPVHGYRVQRRAVGGGANDHDGASGVFPQPNRSRDQCVGGTPDQCEAPPQDHSNASQKPPPRHAQFHNAAAAGSINAAVVANFLPSEKNKSSSGHNTDPSVFSRDWTTVYSGPETEFVDAGISSKTCGLIYRVQSWSSVGRSSWAYYDITDALREEGCCSKASPARAAGGEGDASSSTMQRILATILGSYQVAGVLLLLVRGVFGLAALAAAAMRFRRATAASTASLQMVPVFPWLWRIVNAGSYRLLGVEVVPSSMLGDCSARRGQASEHDVTFGASRLNGYKKTTMGTTVTGTSAPFNRRIAFQQKSMSTGALGSLPGAKLGASSESAGVAAVPKQRALLKKSQSLRVVDAFASVKQGTGLLEQRPVVFPRIEEAVAVPSLDSDGRENVVCISTQSSLDNDSEEGDGLSTGVPREVDDQHFDDHRRCNTCRKQFRLGKRWKHHCSRCLSTFCHKHGRTTHSNFTSCKMPGTCVCLPCLKAEEEIVQHMQLNRHGGD